MIYPLNMASFPGKLLDYQRISLCGQCWPPITSCATRLWWDLQRLQDLASILRNITKKVTNPILMVFYDFSMFFLSCWGVTHQALPQTSTQQSACCKQGKAAPGNPAIMGGTLHNYRVHHSRDTLAQRFKKIKNAMIGMWIFDRNHSSFQKFILLISHMVSTYGNGSQSTSIRYQDEVIQMLPEGHTKSKFFRVSANHSNSIKTIQYPMMHYHVPH